MTDIATITGPAVTKELKAELVEAEQAKDQITGIQLSSAKEGRSFLAEVRTKVAELRATRLALLSPMISAIEQFDKLFHRVLDVYSDIDGILRSRVLVITSNHSVKAEQLINAIRAARDSESPELGALVREFDKLADELGLEGLPLDGQWSFEVVDFESIPHEFLLLNQPKMFYHVSLHRDLTNVPGVRVFRR